MKLLAQGRRIPVSDRALPLRGTGVGMAMRRPRVWAVPITRPGRLVRATRLYRLAPENAQQAVNGLGVLGDGPVPGATQNPGGFWSGISAGLQSDTFKSLASAGMQFLTAQQQRKGAESAARTAIRAADAQAAADQALLMQRAQLAAQQAQGAPASKGLPSWAIPAMVAGGVGVVGLLFFLRKK